MFCSKWTLPDLYMVRDVSKMLNTKQFYTGSNRLLHLYPYYHALAIYEGVKSEKISPLVEAVCEARVYNCERPPTHLDQEAVQSQIDLQNKYCFKTSSKDYHHPDLVDH
jgi:hypothetical protein